MQVRDVAIEAGGLPLVSGVSFTLHSGDKVGLVGRNGVGKTTLLQVLAGEAEASAGVILRRGDLGYLRQDPKLRRADSEVLAVAHILEGRGIAGAAERLEKLRVEVERDPSQRNVARYSRAEEQYRHDGGYAAVRGARRDPHRGHVLQTTVLRAGTGIGTIRLRGCWTRPARLVR